MMMMMINLKTAVLLLYGAHPSSFSCLRTMSLLPNSLENEVEFDEAVKYSAGEGKHLSEMHSTMLDSCKVSLSNVDVAAELEVEKLSSRVEARLTEVLGLSRGIGRFTRAARGVS